MAVGKKARRGRGAALPVLGLAAFVIAVWAVRIGWPSLASVPGIRDVDFYFYPLYDVVYTRLLQGRLPVWNPYNLTGYPWLATVQGGFFYPPHVLYLLLPTHLALAASNAFHLVLAAVATLAFTRRVGVVWPAALAAALLFSLRGGITGYLPWPPLMEAGAWLPVGCLGLVEIARGARTRGAAWLALATGMSLLSGGVQIAVFASYAWAALLLALLVGKGPTQSRVRLAAVAGGGFLLGAALAAVQVLPAWALTGVGSRGLEPLAAGKMLAVTNLGHGWIAFSAPVATTLLAVGIWRMRWHPVAIWVVVVGAAAYGFTLGAKSGIFSAYLLLPGLGWFRNPARASLLVGFLLAVGVALALDALAREPHDVRRRPLRIVAATSPVLLAAVLASRGELLTAGLMLLVGAALLGLTLAPERRRDSVVVAGLAGLVLIEILRGPANAGGLPYGSTYEQAARRLDPVRHELAQAVGSERVLWLGRGTAQKKRAALDGLRLVQDYEPLTLERQAYYLTYGRAPRFFMGGINIWAPVDFWGGVRTMANRLDAASVRYVFGRAAWLDREGVEDFARDRGLVQLPFPHEGFVLFENPRAAPRAFVAHRVDRAPPPDELLERIGSDAFDPLARSYVEGNPGFVPGEDAPRGHAVAIVADEETHIELDVRSSAPGVVVLTDAFDHGWKARVDGEPAPILRTNFLFRGVPVGPGHHEVELVYRPWWITAGVATSSGAAAVLVLLWVHAARAQRSGSSGLGPQVRGPCIFLGYLS